MVVKGFMGSNVVVGVAKVIEHALLGVEVGGGWFGGPGFEGFVHGVRERRFVEAGPV